jgi:predicted MFS family arabinose efflux permease
MAEPARVLAKESQFVATPRVIWLLAVSTGCIVANIYYAQPQLADIARDFGLSVAQIGAVAMVMQTGVAAGMLLFVPLGDKYERRSLLWLLLAAASVSLVLVATARNVIWLSAAAAGVGLTAAAIHVIVPFAAHLAHDSRRGQVVGTVLSGLLAGALLARTFSGLLGAHLGWRAVYWVAAVIMATLALVLRFTLPDSEPDVNLTWPALMRSIVSLVRTHGVLREAAIVSGLLFFSFNALWTTLAFLVESPPYHYGSAGAGLFGLLGASSAMAAPFVGRFSDRRGPRVAVVIAVLTTLAGYLVLLFFGRHLLGLIVAIAAIDAAVQSGHVANQSRIYALAPAARSRVNTFYMVLFFAGAALGSYCGTLGWKLGQWTGFCAFPIAALLLALTLLWKNSR